MYGVVVGGTVLAVLARGSYLSSAATCVGGGRCSDGPPCKIPAVHIWRTLQGGFVGGCRVAARVADPSTRWPPPPSTAATRTLRCVLQICARESESVGAFFIFYADDSGSDAVQMLCVVDLWSGVLIQTCLAGYARCQEVAQSTRQHLPRFPFCKHCDVWTPLYCSVGIYWAYSAWRRRHRRRGENLDRWVYVVG